MNGSESIARFMRATLSLLCDDPSVTGADPSLGMGWRSRS